MRRTAREAGALAMEWLEKGARSWDKSPDNPVTEADLAVNDLIFKRLLDSRPSYGWVSEESCDVRNRRRAKRLFMVDPIDGTRAFIRGEPYFCVSIARLEADQPVAGVVYNPITDELFEAARGSGARLNGEAIQAGARTDLSGLRLIAGAPAFRSNAWPGVELADPTPNSVAYRLCLVAAGRWDAVVSFRPKCDWDLAAAALILEEAGGICTDHLGAALSFNWAQDAVRSVAASGASLHALLIDRLRCMNIGDQEAAPGAEDPAADT